MGREKDSEEEKTMYSKLLADGVIHPDTRVVLSVWNTNGWEGIRPTATLLDARIRAKSPIEIIFSDYLIIQAADFGMRVAVGTSCGVDEKCRRMIERQETLVNFNPQFVVEFNRTYILDFAIFYLDRGTKDFVHKIAIECDGHEFHKSKEQRTSDSARDRDLIKNGFTVFRFTGTELHKNPAKCAAEVLQFIEGLSK